MVETDRDWGLAGHLFVPFLVFKWFLLDQGLAKSIPMRHPEKNGAVADAEE